MEDLAIKNYPPEDRAQILIEALPYIQRFAGRVVLIKIGGSTLVNQNLFDRLAEDVVLLHSVGIEPVIVHGGGKTVSEWGAKLGIRPEFVKGLRKTDTKTLEVAIAILSGLVNSKLVSFLNKNKINGNNTQIKKEGKLFERLKTTKFQGKPPKIKLLRNSIPPKKIEKIKIDEILFFKLKKLHRKVTIP